MPATARRKTKSKRTRRPSPKAQASLRKHETVPVSEFTERSYLNYSMYVVLDRALPSLAVPPAWLVARPQFLAMPV